MLPPPDSLVESLVESLTESLSVSDSVLLSDSLAELLSDSVLLSDSLTDSEVSTLELSVLEDSVDVAPLSQAAIVKQAKSARSKMLIFLFIRLLLNYSSKSPAS
jgi:hypothetical protein